MYVWWKESYGREGGKGHFRRLREMGKTRPHVTFIGTDGLDGPVHSIGFLGCDDSTPVRGVSYQPVDTQ
jgi:hypothetical protein